MLISHSPPQRLFGVFSRLTGRFKFILVIGQREEGARGAMGRRKLEKLLFSFALFPSFRARLQFKNPILSMCHRTPPVSPLALPEFSLINLNLPVSQLKSLLKTPKSLCRGECRYVENLAISTKIK